MSPKGKRGSKRPREEPSTSSAFLPIPTHEEQQEATVETGESSSIIPPGIPPIEQLIENCRNGDLQTFDLLLGLDGNSHIQIYQGFKPFLAEGKKADVKLAALLWSSLVNFTEDSRKVILDEFLGLVGNVPDDYLLGILELIPEQTLLELFEPYLFELQRNSLKEILGNPVNRTTIMIIIFFDFLREDFVKILSVLIMNPVNLADLCQPENKNFVFLILFNLAPKELSLLGESIQKAAKRVMDPNCQKLVDQIKMMMPRSESFHDLLKKLPRFILETGSTAKARELRRAQITGSVKSDIVFEVLESFFPTEDSYQNIVDTFSNHFLLLRDTVDVRELHVPGGERRSVHRRLKEIFKKLIEPMLQEQEMAKEFYFLYEERLEGLEPSVAEMRVRPDFSVHLRAEHSAEIRTFYSMVLPIEAKLPSPGALADGLYQGLSYLGEKARLEIELRRQDPVQNYFGYAIGTDGFNIAVAKMSIEDNRLSIVADFVGQALCPSTGGYENHTLQDFPGLVYLLTLLSAGPAALGHVPTDNYGLQGITVHECLGKGSFGVAILVTTEQGRKACLKMPLFSKEVGVRYSQYRERYQAEVTILKALHQELPLFDYIPHPLREYNYALAILMSDVGMRLADFIHEFFPKREERIDFARKIQELVVATLGEVHQRCNICHCDLRPDNIVMKPRPRDLGTSSAAPVIESSTSAEFGSLAVRKPEDYTPMIIDWGLARTVGSDYDAIFSYAFHHDEIVAKATIKSKEAARTLQYRAEFDIQSVKYIKLAIIANKDHLIAPWYLVHESRYMQERIEKIRELELENYLNE